VRLDRQTALLTGATGGLGKAIARALAEAGAKLVVSSRHDDALEELAASLPGSGHRTVAADLAVDGAAERLVAEFEPLDVFVANAGLPGNGKLESFSQEQIARAVRLNLEAPMRMARQLVPAMLDRGAGHLVFIASLAGKAPTPRSSIYNATKFGLRGFALGLRTDLMGSGVGVSIVSPGFVREAGMFADSGAKPPPPMGTTTPDKVAAGVVTAIERDRPEVAVAPLPDRALAHFGLAAPGLAARTTGGRRGRRTADALAAGNAGKR
jgi:short-subunit dehydrogenase